MKINDLAKLRGHSIHFPLTITLAFLLTNQKSILTLIKET